MHYSLFDFEQLGLIRSYKKQGFKKGDYSPCIIAADTETSKKVTGSDNHICAFSIAFRYDNKNIGSIYGNNPNEFIDCLRNIRTYLKGHDIYIFFHNLAYDWVFIRKFMINAFGEPVKQLNTKPHYPIYIEFENGIMLKDSLILSACNLDKWGEDLDVEHKKAVDKWGYTAIRNQNYQFTEDEILYIQNDVLCLVECIEKVLNTLNKYLFALPYTNTGIVRGECKSIGKKNDAHRFFKKIAPTFEQLDKLMYLFHGGYTQGNRAYYGRIITSLVECYDFASSYPFCMIAYKFPMTAFSKIDDMGISDILKLNDKYAFMFKLILIKPRLKNPDYPMPVLQFSKCLKAINPVLDNGRILSADYIEIMITEVDLEIIENQYTYDAHICTNIEYAIKKYLPRWFTDFVYSLYIDKCKLKNGDPVLYAIAKSKLNSCYGMCVQKPLKDDIVEIYGTGEFDIEGKYNEENYQKYLNKQSSILPYQWGVWVTAYALKNLYTLGECIDYDRGGEWLYSDTDSIYGYLWDKKKVDKYNDKCLKMLQANGYNHVKIKNKIFVLGAATLDKQCSEFIYQGAKRYAYRDLEEELHITVAGVPKKGVECLCNNIGYFQKGFCFPGSVTGKLQVKYNFVDDIYTDMEGNITGDSINLLPCDYILDSEDQPGYYQESIPLSYDYE